MVATWIIGPAYNIAYMTPSAAILPQGYCTVYSEWPDRATQSVVGVLTIAVQFIIPLILLVFGYVRMAIVLHRLVVAMSARSTGTWSQMSLSSRHVDMGAWLQVSLCPTPPRAKKELWLATCLLLRQFYIMHSVTRNIFKLVHGCACRRLRFYPCTLLLEKNNINSSNK